MMKTASLFGNASDNEIADILARDDFNNFIAVAGVLSGARRNFDAFVAEVKEVYARFGSQGRDTVPLRRIVGRLCDGCRGRYDREERAQVLCASFDFITRVPLTVAEIAAIRNSPTWLDFSHDRAEAQKKEKPAPLAYVLLTRLQSIAKDAAIDGKAIFFGTWTEKALYDLGLIEAWGYGRGDKFRWTHSTLSQAGNAALHLPSPTESGKK